MQDFFRDNLGTLNSSDDVIGAWDIHNKNYIISIQKTNGGNEGYKTLNFDESVNGWTSFFSFEPGFMFSLNTAFYSTKNGKIWQHYTFDSQLRRGVFYGTTYPSSVDFVFNANQSLVKNFKTVNYEGSIDWEMDSMATSSDSALPISKSINILTDASNLQALENQLLRNNFKVKEGKYFANLINNSVSRAGEVTWGQSSSGIKGFFATIKMSVDNNLVGKKELFAVSTEYVESSY
jgi:hypothetical protein